MKKVEFDLSKLRGRIVEKYDNYTAFAEALGVSVQQLNPKLTGKTGITKADIIKWCPMLDISSEMIGEYFFTLKVSQG